MPPAFVAAQQNSTATRLGSGSSTGHRARVSATALFRSSSPTADTEISAVPFR